MGESVFHQSARRPLLLTAALALPRRSVQMDAFGPGVLDPPNSGTQLKELSKLAPGDLVFFDASSDHGAAVDHVGMVMGVDRNGDRRFISSRKASDGPPVDDDGGTSMLNGNVGFLSAGKVLRNGAYRAPTSRRQ